MISMPKIMQIQCVRTNAHPDAGALDIKAEIISKQHKGDKSIKSVSKAYIKIKSLNASQISQKDKKGKRSISWHPTPLSQRVKRNSCRKSSGRALVFETWQFDTILVTFRGQMSKYLWQQFVKYLTYFCCWRLLCVVIPFPLSHFFLMMFYVYIFEPCIIQYLVF